MTENEIRLKQLINDFCEWFSDDNEGCLNCPAYDENTGKCDKNELYAELYGEM